MPHDEHQPHGYNNQGKSALIALFGPGNEEKKLAVRR